MKIQFTTVFQTLYACMYITNTESPTQIYMLNYYHSGDFFPWISLHTGGKKKPLRPRLYISNSSTLWVTIQEQNIKCWMTVLISPDNNKTLAYTTRNKKWIMGNRVNWQVKKIVLLGMKSGIWINTNKITGKQKHWV